MDAKAVSRKIGATQLEDEEGGNWGDMISLFCRIDLEADIGIGWVCLVMLPLLGTVTIRIVGIILGDRGLSNLNLHDLQHWNPGWGGS